MNIITLEQLKEHNACVQQLHLFKELFGEEVKVTVEKCLEYYNKFDWVWAAKHLLSDELFKEYKKIEQLAWEEYFNILQPTYKKYLKNKVLVEKEYRETMQPIWEEYRKKIAQAFAKCYLKMEEIK